MKIFVALFSSLLMTFVGSSIQVHLTNYGKLYELGMDAYKQEKWSKCAEFFQKAIDDYHFYKNTVIDCRLKCKEDQSEHTFVSFLSTLHVILESSNCLRRCKKKKLGERAEEEIEFSVDKKFEGRTPYNYMQFCYFKDGKLTKAAAAAYTYYITHQDDTRILENLQYYRTLQEIQTEDFVDLERKPYQKRYIKGLTAYNEGQWNEAAALFEESLGLYFREEERCRAACEKGFVHNGLPDFINAIAEMSDETGMLEWRSGNFCTGKTKTPLVAFYEGCVSNNLEKAFESIASYLLFRPNDEEMLANKNYYIKTLRHKEKEFVPSEDAVRYVELWKQIDKSIGFVRDKYTLPTDQIDDEEGEEAGSNSKDVVDTNEVEGSLNRSQNVKKFEKLGLQLLQESKQLKGKNRFVADGFIREDQCEALADLARSKEFDQSGKRQITVSEVTELVKMDDGYEISMRLLLRAADVMKAFTAAYFSQSGLVVHEVKVNCWSAGAKLDDALPSGCILQENGECKSGQDVIGDYMAVAYLTDMVDSTGQFYFTDENDQVQSSIQPLCGLMLGFSSNDKHQVNLPWKHERCAIVISLTTDKQLQNIEIDKAKDTLSDLEKQRVEEFMNADNADILQEFHSQGVKITQKGDDLQGKERFVADGLVTQEECETLIQLAKREGVSGDGYRGRVSPHTDHEIFTGLDIAHGEQLVKENSVLPGTLQLFLDSSEHARLLVEKYLNLTRPLYFDYTHLVCRTAIDGDTEDREADLSHPVHSDNCMIQPDGSCIPDALAYVQRHYSAVLYLNDNFDGGQFFFAHRNQSEQISVKPQCGRLVAFNAGDYHGVKAVVSGQRCAIAMWFTHDPNFVEVSRLHAQRILQSHSKQEDKKDELTETDVNVSMESGYIDVTADLDTSVEENHDEL
ncbi:prolyl 3-hydroxylase 1-like [Mercenaria mercenaria]|uniref:prolyl 3-hydroxylase 1-like n=1 Tax=Mercenaria mercenaria TaxID=6596 RepID=UPI00234EED03|nr:prolyl 3-hydroxylase 1-like [Mercenaria mercenaria]